MEGNSMVWDLVEEVKQHANVTLDFLGTSKGHSVPRTGGGLTWLGLINRSSVLKWIGVSFVAQHLPTASATGLCSALDSVGPNFDLIGLISAFGTAASSKSLSYSTLNDSSFYLTGHVGPGSLNIAAMLYEITELSLARLLAFGGSGGDDSSSLVQLSSLQGLHYIGLKSNTECPVGNAVGASVVREHQALWESENGNSQSGEDGRPMLGRRVGRDAKRTVEVNILTVEEDNPSKQVRVALKAPKWSALLFGWLPLFLTIAVIVSCCVCEQWVVAGLIAFGTLGMMVAVLGLRYCPFKYSESKVAENAPEGDILVVDDTDADVLHIVKGKEVTIQKLFQRKIIFEGSRGRYVLFVAASMLYIYVLVSVLYMSNVSTGGQIHFAIANIIGLGADMVKASQNGTLGLAKKARDEFKIELWDKVMFTNRTAAIAFVSKHATDRAMLKSKKVLPCDGFVWNSWWDSLAASGPEVKVVDEAAAPTMADNKLLNMLLSDMRDGLEA